MIGRPFGGSELRGIWMRMPVELSEFKVESPCCKLVMAMVICGGPKLTENDKEVNFNNPRSIITANS